MRLSDKNKFVQKSDPGSGRLLYWKTAIKNVTSENTTVLFIGLGEIYALDKMEKNIGERLFAHNKFFQVFQREGIIGFLLMLSMLFSMKSFINRYKNSQYYNTTMALFVGLLIEMFFQGGFYFNIILILGIYLALLKKDSIKHITTKG
jgi:O-antigen ligase